MPGLGWFVARAVGPRTSERLRRLARRGEHRTVRLGAARLAEYKRDHRALMAARVLLEAAGVDASPLEAAASQSKSQLGQDLFALHSSGMKHGGFFVEFGAGDGVRLSNTVMLERAFGWRGILAEPLAEYHTSIRAERAASLEPSCVWSESGRTLDLVVGGYLSTVEEFRSRDLHSEARAGRLTRSPPSISLVDLLRRGGAPPIIDFLSIDTEGSEYEILRAFPFDEEFSILAIACEHNGSADRDRIRRLLEGKGYRRVAAAASRHDDWFVLGGTEAAGRWSTTAG